MKKGTIKKAMPDTMACIRKIDFSTMDISEYNLAYINRLLPHLDYYFKIYENAIRYFFEKENPAGYVVDFGGGHGFLSLLLKQLGQQVIYCDLNPLSVQTITLMKEKLGFGPDFIVEGSSAELLLFCRENKLLPEYLVSTDLIEHVYDLDTFFADLYKLNPSLKMVFTTGSNPSNLYKAAQLRKHMIRDEKMTYLPARKEFIIQNYPDISLLEAEKLATKTRGLTFADIRNYIEEYLQTGNLPERNIDSYNTCDPSSGNWTERILSLKEYRKILDKNHFQVCFKNGFYNDIRQKTVASIVTKVVNLYIRYSGIFGRMLAPYILLKIQHKKE